MTVVAGETRWEQATAAELASELGAPLVSLHDEVDSTLDVAHALARQGAVAGTVVLAESQSAGRGRHGRRWQSARGRGLWLTLVERPRGADATTVMSLRLGLAAAQALDAFAGESVRLKWPNDVWLASGKLAGILVEARWRDGVPEWIAVGFGVNVMPPVEGDGAGLVAGTDRRAVLAALVPALHAAALREGPLDAVELEAWHARDLALGRALLEPVPGTCRGIDARGALLVETATGVVVVRAGSLTFAEGA